MIWRSLQAKWTLAWALIKHVVLLPFVGVRTGRPWLRRLAQERLGPTPQGAWERFEASSRCIGCGLCDAVTPARGLRRADGTPLVLSAWIQSAVRQPEDAPLAVADVQAVRQLAPAVARVCPAGVSVGHLTQLVEAHARVLHEQGAQEGS